LKENKRRLFLGSITSTNYLEENMQTVERWAHRHDDNRFKMALYHERVDECKQRKEEMLIENYKKKVFLCHKWEILREKVNLYP